MAPSKEGWAGDSVDRCFISYARSDGGAAFTRRLFNALASRGIDAWMDEEEIVPGDDLGLRIQLALEHEVQCYLFVLTPAFLQSPWCLTELAAGAKLCRSLGRVAIPILLKSVSIPPALSSLFWVDFSDAELFDQSFESLVKGVQRAFEIERLAHELAAETLSRRRVELVRKLASTKNTIVLAKFANRYSMEPDPEVRMWMVQAALMMAPHGESLIAIAREDRSLLVRDLFSLP